MTHRHIYAVYGLLALFSCLALTSTGAQARVDKATVAAIKDCVKQVYEIVGARKAKGPDVSCDIPINLKERDLNQMFKVAVRAARLNGRWRAYAQKYSPKIAKAVTNFRAADCLMKVRARRADILRGLKADRTVVQLADQPINCMVLTRKRKRKPLSFVLAPKVEMQGGCVRRFSLNMGKINADCRVCLFSRLYLATRLIGLWANHMSGNITKTLNNLLGRSCQ